MNDKLYIIDGHALIFKMYYAFVARPIYSSKGENTSILYGFTKYLFENIIIPHSPTHLAVAFDPPAKTFRHEMSPEYKANRRETPPEVRAALEPLKEICAALNIPVLMLPGYEADDVVCTIAKRQETKMDVYMVTPDKDYAQVVDNHIFMYRPGKCGSDDEVLGVKEVCEKYGVSEPCRVIDYLTICGDTSDNVKGVMGVGEKTAKDLLGKYGTLDGIYSNLDKLTPGLRAKFEAAKDYIGLSQKLVTIKLDVPIGYDEGSLRYTGEHQTLAAELFNRYEFNSLKKYLNVNAVEEVAPQVQTEVKSVPYSDFAAKVVGQVALYIDGSTNYFAAKKDNVIYTTATSSCELLASEAVVKIGHNFKDIYKVRPVKGHIEDLEVLHYLLASELPHDLEYLRSNYLSQDPSLRHTSHQDDGCSNDLFRHSEPAEESLFLFGEEAFADEPQEVNYENLAADILQIHECLPLDESLRHLYEEIEEPLIKVLSDMEIVGVNINLESLEEYIAALREKAAYHEKNVRIMAGDPALNLSSPKQIGELIFEKLQLDPTVKGKKGRRYAYSTDEETLSALRETHPVIDEILEFRTVKKLLCTYIEPLPKYRMQDGKIRTTFNQCTTATGRLSSSNPNLQNIPVRTPLGSQIRAAFVPSDPEGFIMSADYSQIELRILAHLCGDQYLIDAFRTGIDVHSVTAAKIFRCDVDEVTPEQRRIAKTANFGILYGISSFGLAARLKISRKRASQIIDDYFESFGSVKAYIENQLSIAREKGYVETIFARKRYVPQITASNVNIRGFAERVAINSPIQGASADIIKKAMINVSREMSARGLKSRMTLQIHDELLFDVVPGEQDELKELVVRCMEGVVKLDIPLKVECNYGKNWLEVH